MMGGFGLGMGLFALLIMVLLVVLVVGGAVWLVTVLARPTRGFDQPSVSAPRLPARETPQETPMEILRRRLAAGEITLEEYDQLRQKLSD